MYMLSFLILPTFTLSLSLHILTVDQLKGVSTVPRPYSSIVDHYFLNMQQTNGFVLFMYIDVKYVMNG